MEKPEFSEQHGAEFKEIEQNSLVELTLDAYGYVLQFARHKVKMGSDMQIIGPRPSDKDIANPPTIKLSATADIRGVDELFEVVFVTSKDKLATNINAVQLDNETAVFSVLTGKEHPTYKPEKVGRYSINDLITIMSSVRNKYEKALKELY